MVRTILLWARRSLWIRIYGNDQKDERLELKTAQNRTLYVFRHQSVSYGTTSAILLDNRCDETASWNCGVSVLKRDWFVKDAPKSGARSGAANKAVCCKERFETLCRLGPNCF